MSTAYNHKTVEKKWQKYWQENEIARRIGT